MLKLSLRDLRAHVGRYLLTFLAVTIGVAFVAGVITLTDTISRTLDDLYAGLNRGTDVAVRGAGQFKLGPEFGGAVQRPRVSALLADEVAEVDGVAAAEGYLQGFTRPIGPDGVPYGNPTFGFPTLGTNWGVVDELNPFDIVEGRPPEGPDEIALDKRTMDETGYRVGDIASFQTASGVSSAQIVGVARFGNSDSPGGASVTLFDNDTAQMLLAGPGQVDQVSVLAEPGVSQERARDAVADALAGEDLEIVTGRDLIDEAQDTAQASFTGVRTFLLVFALISVLVGTFVIYTSFSFIVAQRQRQVALLRAIGAGRGQVLTSVVLESLVVGAVASLLGYVLGVVLARTLAQAFLPGSVTDVRPTAFAVSVGVGTVVTVVSAFFPAARAVSCPAGGGHARRGHRHQRPVDRPRRARCAARAPRVGAARRGHRRPGRGQPVAAAGGGGRDAAACSSPSSCRGRSPPARRRWGSARRSPACAASSAGSPSRTRPATPSGPRPPPRPS